MLALEARQEPPDEMIEYEYRRIFGYTHREYDEIPSKRLTKDFIVMGLINQHKNFENGTRELKNKGNNRRGK